MEKTRNKGITLIALIITIIVMLILVGVTVNIALNGGLFGTTTLASFATEMKAIKENVEVKKSTNAIQILNGEIEELFNNKLNENSVEIPDTLKREILYVRDGYPSNKEINEYDVDEFSNLIDNQGNVEGIYIIDKETANGKENTYIYDKRTDVVFKIPKTKINKKIYHSYECASLGSGSEEEVKKDLIVNKESDVIKVGDELYYAPNMNGFSTNNTYMIYYSEDFTQTKEVSVKEYIENGELYEIQKDEQTYTLHDYGAKKWANVKTNASGQKAWWVWIPRYAYKINGTSNTPPIDVIYVGIDNEPLNKEKYPNGLPEGYEVHPGFTAGDKQLKGIWMSKYEPSYSVQTTIDGVLAPDMTGFDEEHTYIEIYDKETDTFKSEVKLSQADLSIINANNEWYDYKNKIWANIKTNANGQKAWWVWIPRYAYKITTITNIKTIDIIYVGLDNKPINKTEYPNGLPEGYEVHPGFTAGDKQLKGIWMSKYEPSYSVQTTIDGVLAPDMTGFDEEHTYIEIYDKETDTFKSEVKLSQADLSIINANNEWYDYKNKIWANIKTNANGQKAWWVWIPRYAYKITNITNTKAIDIIFVGLDNKPINKTEYPDGLPEGYEVHPGFTAGDKQLKGIWMSKYEPSKN